MAQISLQELEMAVRLNRLSKDDLQRYFTTDPIVAPAPMFPGLRIREDAVDLLSPGVRTFGLDSFIARLIIQNQRNDRDRRFADKRRTDPDAKVVVTDGDSWFLHPLMYDVIDRLIEACAVKSLDWPGDELSSIAEREEYLFALEETGASILLISAGGNDLVAGGGLADHLAEYEASRTARDLLLPSYTQLIRDSIRHYNDIFEKASAVASVVKIFCHGYDYVIPASGRWLGKPMECRHIPPHIQRDIAKIMVDHFNRELADLAQHHGKVSYLDLRGAVPVGEWDDELHPTEEGYLAVAARFRAEIGI